MVTYVEVAGINGAEFIAKGLERGFEEIDVVTNRALLKPHLRPSTWLNVGMGLATQLGAVFARIRRPWDLILVAEGSHHLTKIVDYVEEYVTPAPAAAARAAAARVVYRPSGNQRVMTRERVVAAGVPASYDVNPYTA